MQPLCCQNGTMKYEILPWEASWPKLWLEWLGMIQCKEIGALMGMNSPFGWIPAHLPWELPLKHRGRCSLASSRKWCTTHKPGWTWRHFKGSYPGTSVASQGASHRWITETLTGKAQLTTKASCEMLIWRRLATLAETIKEYNLVVDVVLIRSAMNKADALTWIPQWWLNSAWKRSKPLQQPCAAITHSLDSKRIMSIHRQCRHPGIKQMLYFTRMVDPAADKVDVRMVVKRCEVFQLIDLAPVQWKKGQPGASNARQRLGMDFTHYGGTHLLTLINCGPTRFAVWRLIVWQDSSSVICQLSLIFFERRAPEILADNNPIFCSQQVKQFFLQEWGGVWLWLQCAYIPMGNDIAERIHHSIKKIAVRKQSTILEVMHIIPKDGAFPATASADAIYRYWGQGKGIHALQVPDNEEKRTPYTVGDIVWIKPLGSLCGQSSLSRGQWNSAPYKRPTSFSGTGPAIQK